MISEKTIYEGGYDEKEFLSNLRKATEIALACGHGNPNEEVALTCKIPKFWPRTTPVYNENKDNPLWDSPHHQLSSQKKTPHNSVRHCTGNS